MLQLFRNFFHTRWGVGLTLGLFVIIALAFGLGDVASNGGFGGNGANADWVAKVGTIKISPADLSREETQDFQSSRQQDPTLTMPGFIAQGGFEDVASQLFDRAAITTFGAQNGIIAGKRLVDSELAKIPALQGPDGKFSESLYQQILTQRQMTDTDIRTQIGSSMVLRQILTPAQYGAAEPASIVARYAALLKEKRIGSVGVLPSVAFASKTPPSDAELASFYAQHRDLFMRPERRVIRYALFDDSVAKNIPAPTDAQISADYTANAAAYAPSESRKVTQLILPDEASAKAIAAQGGSLDAAAKAKGLSANALPPLTRDALAQQSDPALAAAVFAAKSGALVGPVHGALGWYVAHVDAVDAKAGQNLAQAHDVIAATLAGKLRAAALADITSRIEDQFEKGGALNDAAQQIGVTLTQTAPLTSDGKVFGTAQTAPKELARIVPTAFQMDREGQPQLAELVAGKSFVIFDVGRIAPAAPAPLAEIHPLVATAIMLVKGQEAAHAAALKVLAATRRGDDLGKAMSGLGVALPPIQPVSMSRDQLAQMQNHVPPVLSLFFGMAPGTTKLLPVSGSRGWMVVHLAQAQQGTLAANDPMIAGATRELGQLASTEYSEELRHALHDAVGVKRNEAAIAAVRSQLTGGN